jgi:hypothetical protein
MMGLKQRTDSPHKFPYPKPQLLTPPTLICHRAYCSPSFLLILH